MRISAILTILSLFALPVFAAEELSPASPASCANATPAPLTDTLSEQDWQDLGFQVFDQKLMAGSSSPTCPNLTSCTRFSGCEDTNNCNTVDTGDPCCSQGKFELCCIVGTMHITRCACTTECHPFCDPCPVDVARDLSCQ